MIALLQDGHAPGDVALTVIQRWKDVLAASPGQQLSENALIGLFGELEILETILKEGGSLDHWTGWNKDHADFRLEGLVIEVKTTSSANYRRVSIHGLGQLDDPQDGSDLLLVLKRVESSPTGRSVPSIIEDLVKLGVSRSALLDALANVGYREEHRSHYERTIYSFNSVEVAVRRIDDGHPRLVPSMLDGVDLSSIDKVDYTLNLNGDAEKDDDLDSTVEELVSKCL